MEFSPNLSFSIKKKKRFKSKHWCVGMIESSNHTLLKSGRLDGLRVIPCDTPQVTASLHMPGLLTLTFRMRFLCPCREALLLPQACCVTSVAGSHSSRRRAGSDCQAEKGKGMTGTGTPSCWRAHPSVSQSAQRFSDWPHMRRILMCGSWFTVQTGWPEAVLGNYLKASVSCFGGFSGGTRCSISASPSHLCLLLNIDYSSSNYFSNPTSLPQPAIQTLASKQLNWSDFK